MNFISRMLRGFVVMTTLGLTGISLSVNWLFDGGVLSESFDNCIKLLEAQGRNEQLGRETQITMERVQNKGRIAEALQNGEMKLIDAARCYFRLHQDPKSWRHPFRPRPDDQDIEGWCREVIEWTEKYTNPEQSPGQVEALRQRLEKEMQEQLKRHSAVKLRK
jgi:aminoglycoside phosphotransferase family enzyme